MKDTINEIKAIELSLQDPDELNQATNFRKTTVSVSDLREKLTSHNFSTIIWAENYRSGEKFRYVTGMLLDFDHSASFSEVHASLIMDGLNHFMITSKSHNIEKNGEVSERFHVIIPFSEDVTDPNQLERLYEHFLAKFPDADRNAKGLARHFYNSPTDATYADYWEGHYFNPNPFKFSPENDIPVLMQSVGNRPKSKHHGYQEFDATDVFKTKGGIIQAKDYLDEDPLPVNCNFHEDKNPSAFLKFDSDKDKWFTSCSSCGVKAWSKQTGLQLKLSDTKYCYLGTSPYEYGLSDSGVFLTKISRENLQYSLGIEDKETLDSVVRFLVQERCLKTSPDYEAILDMDLKERSVTCDFSTGKLEIKHAPQNPNIKNNQMVEDYLIGAFGPHVEFIKQYLALYCYTNFLPLPTLFFAGPRSAGKSTFIEMMRRLCPALYSDWSGEEKDFNPEFEKRLLVVEENLTEKKAFYRTLKKITGQPFLQINKKNQPQFNVRNNLVPIVVSNEIDSLYLEQNEIPSSELDNQWFIWKFKKVEKPDPTFTRRLSEAFPHYAQTVLRQVYADLKAKGLKGRYQIPVPITEYLKPLFNTNISAAETDTNTFIDILEAKNWTALTYRDGTVGEYDSYYQAGYLPTGLVDFILKQHRIHTTTSQIIKHLKNKGYISHEGERVRIGKSRFSCNLIIKVASSTEK